VTTELPKCHCGQPAEKHVVWLDSGSREFVCRNHLRVAPREDDHEIVPDCAQHGAMWLSGGCAVLTDAELELTERIRFEIAREQPGIWQMDSEEEYYGCTGTVVDSPEWLARFIIRLTAGLEVQGDAERFDCGPLASSDLALIRHIVDGPARREMRIEFEDEVH
jgi:hypothetical protein